MLSEKGQNEMAEAIYNAFVTYKASYDGKSDAIAAVKQAQANAANYDEHVEEEHDEEVADDTAQEVTAQATHTPGKRLYNIHFIALPKKLKAGSSHFKGLSPVEVYYDKGYYKYTYGGSTTREGIESDFRKVRKLFKDAFIIVMQDGKRVE